MFLLSLPLPALSYVEGKASWYSLPGNLTASGEVMDPEARTAAHRFLPFGTTIRIKNLSNGKQTSVRVNDRGPFVSDRIIDLSYRAAEDLGMVEEGVIKVRLIINGED